MKKGAKKIREMPKLKFTALYIISIPLTNWLFLVLPPLLLPDGTPLTVAVFIVGFVFILRDLCQREVGNLGALVAMVAAAVFTWFLATPALAMASMAAFLVGEMADWLVYTLTRRPLHERVLYSSLVSCPVDTAVFLLAAQPIIPGLFTWNALVIYALCKILVAVAMYYVIGWRAARMAA
jgi:queuosine precursor transporter